MSDPWEMFKVLGVETRVRIIELLKFKGPLGTKNIAETVGITPAAVSQHLKVLRQAGLVRNERKGYWIPYSIDEKVLENCRRILTEVCTCGCQGAGGVKKRENSTRSSLASLIQHEKTLQKELQNVREKISEFQTKGK